MSRFTCILFENGGYFMKKGRKRLFAALAASLVLLVTVPLMAAFAGEGDAAVSGSDVSGSDAAVVASVGSGSLKARAVAPKLSQTSPDDGPDMDADWDFWVWYQLGFDDRNFNAGNNTAWFNGRDESVSVTVADAPDTTNAFLYWRDVQTGKIYHPGDTLTVKVAELTFYQDEYYNEETGTLENHWLLNPWTLKAIWEPDILEIDVIGGLYLAEPELNPNPYRVGYLADDGLNIYNWSREVQGNIKGTLDLKTDKFTLKQGYDKIQIPGDYVPEIAGDTFVEWNTSTDGSGRGYQPGEYVALSDIGESVQWVELYAIFENATKRNVLRMQISEWRVSDDTGTELVVQFDDNGVIPSVTFPAALTNSLNEFAGWRNDVNKQIYEPGKTYYNLNVNDIAFDESAGTAGSKFAYFEGVWKGDQLAFEKTGGLYLEFEGGFRSLEIALKGVHTISDGKWTFEGNPAITIPADSAPDNERGYTFLGWNTSQYGVGKMYQPGESVPFTDYPWITLYATYQSDQDFTVTETSGEVMNIITDAEPVVGLVLQNDVSIDEVKMVVGKVEENLEEEVRDAISQQAELKEIEGQPNIQMIDIKLVDSQNHGVSIETGKIKIVMAYPDIPNAKDYYYTIYHYKNGVAEKVPVEKYEDGLVFFADSFSPYALVWSKEPADDIDDSNNGNVSQPTIPETPKSGDNGDDSTSKTTTDSTQTTETPATGDNFSPVIFIVLLVVAAAAAGTVLVRRNKKSKIEEQANA